MRFFLDKPPKPTTPVKRPVPEEEVRHVRRSPKPRPLDGALRRQMLIEVARGPRANAGAGWNAWANHGPDAYEPQEES